MRIIIILFVFWSFGLYAQRDFGIWAGADMKYSYNKKLTFGLEYQWRFDQNVTQLNNTFISPYLSYKFKKYFEVGLSYRWTNESASKSYFGPKNFHRITIDLEAKNLQDFILKDTRIDIGCRLRSTHETERGDLNSDYLRGQIEVKYNVKGVKLEPFISFEGFLHFNDQLIYTSDNVKAVHRFNKLRYRIGCKYEVMDNHEVNVFYMIQDELESLSADFVLGVVYSFKLQRD